MVTGFEMDNQKIQIKVLEALNRIGYELARLNENLESIGVSKDGENEEHEYQEEKK